MAIDDGEQEETLESSLNADLVMLFEEVTGEEAPATKERDNITGYPDFGLPDKEAAAPVKEELPPVAAPSVGVKSIGLNLKLFRHLFRELLLSANLRKKHSPAQCRKPPSRSVRLKKFTKLLRHTSSAPFCRAHLPTVLTRMLSWQEILFESDPVTGLAELAKTLGVDPRINPATAIWILD